ncbi:unnamed protein product [Trichobilharzia regenti]|nr:unnamed protein product [Trichobilharzia regenti]
MMRIQLPVVILTKQLRERLEEELKQPLRAYRHFIEKQILTIYGQMDEASVIFDHVLLGTTFNASNRDELERRNVTHILNVTREIDNFFPGDKFEYKNIRTRCLVHCKMGISRSASTVSVYCLILSLKILKAAVYFSNFSV